MDSEGERERASASGEEGRKAQWGVRRMRVRERGACPQVPPLAALAMLGKGDGGEKKKDCEGRHWAPSSWTGVEP